MLPDGYWNLTAVKVFRGKAITHHGLIRKQNVWHRRKKPKANVRKHWSASWSGCVCSQKHGRPKERPVYLTMRSWHRKKQRKEKINWSYLFHPVRVWVMW